MSLLRIFVSLLIIMLWTPPEVMWLFRWLVGNLSAIDVLFIILLTPPILASLRRLKKMAMEEEEEEEIERSKVGIMKALLQRDHHLPFEDDHSKAMFKVKSILHEKDLRDSEQINSLVSDRKKHSKGSRVMHLRERFNTGLEQNAVSSSPRRGVINDAQDVDKFSSFTQHKEVADHTPDMNQSINVVCPTPKSVKDIIHSWEQRSQRYYSFMGTNSPEKSSQYLVWSTSDRVKIDISRHDVITPQQNGLDDEQSIVSQNLHVPGIFVTSLVDQY